MLTWPYIDHTQAAKVATEHSESKYKLSPRESDATCIRQYGNTVDGLKKGRDAAKASDNWTSNSMLSAVIMCSLHHLRRHLLQDTCVEHHGQAERLLEEDGGQRARARPNIPRPSVKGKEGEGQFILPNRYNK
ncbi:hypothetical protein Cni_G08500 [Canna indica]|uniref:Uncharacterized protein n=1 Tax=Canna indica TaxID=4628 RepID=A0AAQ3Q6V4_9LILI|nr:hypothetical protein Cni_G08500 [Canna indica]